MSGIVKKGTRNWGLRVVQSSRFEVQCSKLKVQSFRFYVTPYSNLELDHWRRFWRTTEACSIFRAEGPW